MIACSGLLSVSETGFCVLKNATLHQFAWGTSTNKLHTIRGETFLRWLVDLATCLLGTSCVLCVCVSAQSWQHYTHSSVTVFFNICPLGEWPTRLPHRGIQYTLRRGKLPLLCPTTETAVLIYHVCYAAFETPAIFPSKHHRGGH